MNKTEIKNNLQHAHRDFLNSVLSLTDEQFLFSTQGKWTAGQQLDHIYRSVSAVALGVRLPKLLLKVVVGKANRPSHDYNTLINKYKVKLERGGKAGGRFIPNHISLSKKDHLARKFTRSVEILNRRINRFSEEQLDEYILPHPLLGKLTIREMLYFTVHHAIHHQQLVLRNLAIKDW
jgi:hypothetical protein